MNGQFLKTACIGAAMLATGAVGATAADLPAYSQTPVVIPAAYQSPWQIRVRALGVVTNDKGSVDGIPGSDLKYSDSVIPELDISYYFTPNIAAELILGTTKAGIYSAGTIAGLGKVGSTWVLPPTLTLQYHFTNFGAFKPYVGAGVNYTVFYSEKNAGPFAGLNVKNSFGFALQAGFDYMIDAHWGLNLDVKKLFLKPSWSADLGGVPLTGKAKLDPWLIGAGITYRF